MQSNICESPSWIFARLPRIFSCYFCVRRVWNFVLISFSDGEISLGPIQSRLDGENSTSNTNFSLSCTFPYPSAYDFRVPMSALILTQDPQYAILTTNLYFLVTGQAIQSTEKAIQWLPNRLRIVIEAIQENHGTCTG